MIGTLGDAVLRLSLTNILYHSRKDIDISEERKKYESDKVLVEKIASYYRLGEILLSDDENEDKNHGYDYWEYKRSGDHPQKFLATAMEALLGAYYLDHNESIKEVEPVVRRWMEIIDSCTELRLGNHEHGLASKIFTRTLGFKHGGVISEYNSMNLCF